MNIAMISPSRLFLFFCQEEGGWVYFGRYLLILISHVMAGFQWQPANQIPNYGNT
jgi:hypothetical protein